MRRALPSAAVLLALAAAPALAQDALETPMVATLERLLNGGTEADTFLTRFNREGRCQYTLGFGQELEDGARRMSVTPLDFAHLSAERTKQTYYDIGISEITLNLRDNTPHLITALTLDDPAGSQRQAYLDTYEGTCDGDTCTMEAPSRSASFVVLGPDAQEKGSEAYLALLALVEACAEPAKEGN